MDKANVLQKQGSEFPGNIRKSQPLILTNPPFYKPKIRIPTVKG